MDELYKRGGRAKKKQPTQKQSQKQMTNIVIKNIIGQISKKRRAPTKKKEPTKTVGSKYLSSTTSYPLFNRAGFDQYAYDKLSNKTAVLDKPPALQNLINPPKVNLVIPSSSSSDVAGNILENEKKLVDSATNTVNQSISQATSPIQLTSTPPPIISSASSAFIRPTPVSSSSLPSMFIPMSRMPDFDEKGQVIEPSKPSQRLVPSKPSLSMSIIQPEVISPPPPKELSLSEVFGEDIMPQPPEEEKKKIEEKEEPIKPPGIKPPPKGIFEQEAGFRDKYSDMSRTALIKYAQEQGYTQRGSNIFGTMEEVKKFTDEEIRDLIRTADLPEPSKRKPPMEVIPMGGAMAQQAVQTPQSVEREGYIAYLLNQPLSVLRANIQKLTEDNNNKFRLTPREINNIIKSRNPKNPYAGQSSNFQDIFR